MFLFCERILKLSLQQIPAKIQHKILIFLNVIKKMQCLPHPISEVHLSHNICTVHGKVQTFYYTKHFQ